MSNSEFNTQYGPAALVTGASSGIGKSYAKLLAAKGLDLLLVARRVDQLKALKTKLEAEHSVSVSVCEADLSQTSSVALIVEAAKGLDIGLLVNNAGFGLKGAHHKLSEQDLAEMLNVNCFSPMQLSHAFIPRLLKRGSGGLLFTGSVEGLMGFPNSAAYSGTKAFVQNFTESLWGELEDKNIDVLVLKPSSTDTEALDKQRVDRSKLAGMMTPDEVAQIGLDNLKNGPVVIAGESNSEMFLALQKIPRRDALRMMGATMADSLLPE
jgi:hypothetical protein